MGMESTKRNVVRSCKAFTYSVLLFALISIAIWDVAKIVDDYLHQNRFTLLKQEYVTDNFTFLENPRMCLRYPKEKTFFQEAWSLRKSELEQLVKEKRRRATFCNKTDNSYSVKQLSLKDKMDIMELLDKIEKLDSLDTSATDYGDWLESIESEIDNPVDEFITNPCVEKVVDAFWAAIQPTFVRSGVNEADVNGTSITPLFANPQQAAVCFVLSLNAVLSINKDTVTYSFDFPPPPTKTDDKEEESKSRSQAPAVKAEAFLLGSPTNTFTLDIQPGAVTVHVVLQISNVGVYDRRNFPPCTQDFSTKDDCITDAKIRTISRHCRCVPFSKRRHFDMEKMQKEQRQFCTTKHYKQCRTEALSGSMADMREYDPVCTPCIAAKNSYFVSTYYQPWKGEERGNVVFECLDKFYSLFQERQQYQFAQLVAQIGGNLGIYLGFNLLTLVGFLIFFFNTNDTHVDEPRQAGTSWIKHVINRMKGIITGGAGDDDKGMKMLKMEMEENFSELQTYVRELEVKVDHLRKENQSLKAAYNETRGTLV